MKSGGSISSSNNIEEPSLEFIRRFQNMLDEDDESDYKLVSLTRQRLDHLLSSKDDQVIDVSKPSRITDRTEEPKKLTAASTFTERVQGNLFTLASFLATFILYYLWKHGKSQPKATTRTNSSTVEGKTLKVSESQDLDLQESKLREAIVPSNASIERKDQESGESEVPALQTEDSRKSPNTSEIMNESSSSSLVAWPTNTAEPPNATTSLPTRNLMRTNNSDATPSQTTITQADSDESGDSILRFTKMARDIQLAEDVLTENGMEKSLAQQVAVSMTTSQAVMESQRHLETQRIMMDSHHRNLDRQLSQRQHEEFIHASKYDPNWNEKLERKRDMCWTVTTRIVSEVLVIHYLSMVLRPVIDSFSSQPRLSFQELGRLAIYSICDCGSSTDEIVSSSITTSLFSTPRALYLLELVGLDFILAMDTGLCYGYCLLTFGCTLVLAATVHQGLRLFSAPSVLHQMVNIAALVSLFGGKSIWHLHLSTEAILSFSKTHMLGIVLLSVYALVQWNYSNCRQRVRQACKSSPIRFPESFDRSLQQLDTLHSQLCFLRYAMVAVFCTSIFMSAN